MPNPGRADPSGPTPASTRARREQGGRLREQGARKSSLRSLPISCSIRQAMTHARPRHRLRRPHQTHRAPQRTLAGARSAPKPPSGTRPAGMSQPPADTRSRPQEKSRENAPIDWLVIMKTCLLRREDKGSCGAPAINAMCERKAR
ncbi:uncharacterized protein SCHCODRAFT_02038941 [Schizophyllum commune H4-8]|uniref:uncharacterized protein n=1 Tax=Schizophyllum commune (strain H4-8 / FGSC 9210) TaxID=578458 RepID=UPI0021609A19|nr:uncharacterized protein SCHCODRAFT_02038941 [Schizophyllum commune H4-8]KAI5900547.1 hypothetical protein SCHCODRAFT_02038941 [Schizophyllum commune H4-8]